MLCYSNGTDNKKAVLKPRDAAAALFGLKLAVHLLQLQRRKFLSAANKFVTDFPVCVTYRAIL